MSALAASGLPDARRTERAGEVRHRFGVGQRSRPDRELRRRVPIAALDRVARRAHG